MKRSEGFSSQCIWVSGGAKPVKEVIMSNKLKKEVEVNKKLAQYEAALKEENIERIARIKAEKSVHK